MSKINCIPIANDSVTESVVELDLEAGSRGKAVLWVWVLGDGGMEMMVAVRKVPVLGHDVLLTLKISQREQYYHRVSGVPPVIPFPWIKVTSAFQHHKVQQGTGKMNSLDTGKSSTLSLSHKERDVSEHSMWMA